jgi:hypothetical protein
LIKDFAWKYNYIPGLLSAGEFIFLDVTEPGVSTHIGADMLFGEYEFSMRIRLGHG